MKKSADWMRGLSTRVRNVLLSEKVVSKNEAIKLIENGDIKKIPGMGERSISEIRNLLNIPPRPVSKTSIGGAITLLTKHGYQVTKIKEEKDIISPAGGG